MGKKYDFDKLFDGAHDTVEYWQERHEIAHGEMLARDAEIEALKARIAELEEQNRILRLAQKACADCEDVQRMAMCEQEHVLLTPDRLYAFSPIAECVECQRLMDQFSAPSDALPVSPLPEPPKQEDAP